MLDKIIDLVKDQALGAITNNTEIPAEMHGPALEATTSALVDGLKQHLTPDNLSSIMGLLGGGASAGGNNALMSGLQNSVVSALSEKVGLNPSVANSIASTAIPAIMNLLSQKNDDPKDSFNFESLVSSFTGKDSRGLLGTLGKLFG